MSAHNPNTSSTARAYASKAYADALTDAGVPRLLPESGAWILERAIDDAPERRDGMGLYPLFACPRWRGLDSDLRSLDGQLVSLVVVTDPFHPPDSEAAARSVFPDLCTRWKDHVILQGPSDWEGAASQHHRRYARAAQRKLQILRRDVDVRSIADWQRLYGELIARHNIQGLTRFSPEALKKHIEHPDVLVFSATDANDVTVGMALFIVAGDDAWYHLGASSPEGYAAKASFGIFAVAFEELARRGVQRVDLGAAAGANAGANSGLFDFKSGWSENRLPTWLCGRIHDTAAYETLRQQRRGSQETSFFPAYRAP
jgi:hypothetical protein